MAPVELSVYANHLQTSRLSMVLQPADPVTGRLTSGEPQPLERNEFLDFCLALMNHPKAIAAMGDLGVKKRETFVWMLDQTSVPGFSCPGQNEEAAWAGMWSKMNPPLLSELSWHLTSSTQAVFLSENEGVKPIGCISMSQRELIDAPEGTEPFPPDMGWAFVPEYWGKGYATEAAGAILQHLLQNSHLKVISALPIPSNLASSGVAKKIGMSYWGDMKLHGEEGSSAVYAVAQQGMEDEAQNMLRSWGQDVQVAVLPEGFKADT